MFQFNCNYGNIKLKNPKIWISNKESIHETIETLNILRSSKTSKFIDIHFKMLNWPSNNKVSSSEKNKLLLEIKRKITFLI